MLRGFVILMSVAAVLMAAGCNGTDRLSRQEYGARLQAIDAQVGGAEEAAQAAFASGSSLERLTRAIRSWADAEEQAGNELAAVRPPRDAEEANRSLSAAEKHFAAELRKAAAALKGVRIADAPAILEREMGSSPAAAQLDHAIARLKALGYAHG